MHDAWGAAQDCAWHACKQVAATDLDLERILVLDALIKRKGSPAHGHVSKAGNLRARLMSAQGLSCNPMMHTHATCRSHPLVAALPATDEPNCSSTALSTFRDLLVMRIS